MAGHQSFSINLLTSRDIRNKRINEHVKRVLQRENFIKVLDYNFTLQQCLN